MNEVSYKKYSGRLIQDEACKGAFNMAADLYFSQESRRTSEPFLRLYTWDKPTLSLGFHQKVPETVRNRCLKNDIPIVRRPTGGRAVLHDRELTYCLCLPLKHPLFQSARGELLRQIGEIFVSAASLIGVKAELVRAGNRLAGNEGVLRKGSPLCFDSVSRWEVQISGHKWIGSAQRFFPDVLLQHGSILLGESDVDLGSLFGLTNRTSEQAWNQSKSSHAHSAAAIKEDDLRRTIPEAFCIHWDITWRAEPTMPAEIELITSSIQEYQDRWELGSQLRSDQVQSKLNDIVIAQS